MGFVLKQVRTCDGACCIESPRFPNKDHSDCIYRDSAKPDRGCMLMDGTAEIPEGPCPAIERLTAKEAFQQTCVDWPQNSLFPGYNQTAGCCWKWEKDGIT